MLTILQYFHYGVQQEHRVFMELIDSYLGLLDHLMNGEEENTIHVGELSLFYQMGKGASSARDDDMKTLKSIVFEWLVPRGQAVIPPLTRNIKYDHGFNHKITKQHRVLKAVRSQFVVTNGLCSYMLKFQTHLAVIVWLIFDHVFLSYYVHQDLIFIKFVIYISHIDMVIDFKTLITAFWIYWKTLKKARKWWT
ncbi:hypothetical protein EDD22DRAFT_848157 [Suillus occidentalis]|nr:hypothetical protein EDD22DRAFT_848157 [Suillus occidentalis]